MERVVRKRPVGTKNGAVQNAELERIKLRVACGEVRIGAAAAREIAQRIERQGGFWGQRVS